MEALVSNTLNWSHYGRNREDEIKDCWVPLL